MRQLRFPEGRGPESGHTETTEMNHPGPPGDDTVPRPAAPPAAHAEDAARPFVSVVIPHYNDIEALTVCVAGLHRQNWPADRMEIIVADNNSACGLEAVADASPRCRVVHAPIQGAGPARNAGVEASRGEILAFIDSDCDPRPDWIENGVRALADHDFAGGHVDTAPRDPNRPTPVEAWEMVFGFDFERYILTEGYTGSGNMWVWRRVFDAVGGFRAGVAEDMDWSFRATAAGYRLGYERKAIVSHLARANWSDLLKRWRRVAAEHYALTRQRPAWLLRWLAWTAGMPFSIGPHLVRVLRSDRLPDLRSKVEASAVLVAHRLWRTCFMVRLLFASSSGATGNASVRSAALAGSLDFLGLAFADFDMTHAVTAVRHASEGREWCYVVTPNAAHLARLSRSGPELLRTYENARLCFLDSRAISLVARLAGLHVPRVIPGSDLVDQLFRCAISPATPICVVGGGDGVTSQIKARFNIRTIDHMNPTVGFWRKPEEIEQIVAFIVASGADYTFLVVGSPQQEFLAARVAAAGGARGVGICAGASLDFITGVQRRAPRFLQRMALEWAYRFCVEPRRLAHRYIVESPRGVLFVLRKAFR